MYLSRTGARATGPDLADIVRTSVANNKRDGVTGLLLHDGRRFLQAIEGDERLVAACFARIAGDGRHSHVEILEDVDANDREFAGWSLRAFDMAGGASAYREQVAELASAVQSATLRAILIGFAAMAH